MIYTLEMTFTGLFLFVPDRANSKLHVLLPTTEHGGHSIDQHKWCLHHENTQTQIMDGFIDLTEIPASTTWRPLPETIADAGDLVGKTVKHSQLESAADAGIKGRIRLSAPRILASGETALWELRRDEYVFLTNRLRLGWRVDGTSLKIKIASSADTVVKELRPDSDGLLRVHFTHLPDDDEEIGIGEEAEHFNAYYHVFGGIRGPKPKLRERPRKARFEPRDKEEFVERKWALSTFTCMVAQAQVE
jgi:hypothetical protein